MTRKYAIKQSNEPTNQPMIREICDLNFSSKHYLDCLDHSLQTHGLFNINQLTSCFSPFFLYIPKYF